MEKPLKMASTILNSNSVGDTSNQNVVVIIDEDRCSGMKQILFQISNQLT